MTVHPLRVLGVTAAVSVVFLPLVAFLTLVTG